MTERLAVEITDTGDAALEQLVQLAPGGRRRPAARRIDIGRGGEGAGPGRLVINPLMPASDPAALKAAAEKFYRGAVTVAEDLLEI